MGSPRDTFGRTLDEGARETLRDLLTTEAVMHAPGCTTCENRGYWIAPNAPTFLDHNFRLIEDGDDPRCALAVHQGARVECSACGGTGGQFVLSSGRKAAYYIDVARISQREPGFSALATLVASEAWDRGAHQLGGVIAGGVPLALAGMFGIRRYGVVAGRSACAFAVRDGMKQHGAGGAIAGSVDERLPVMLVEDVVSTGASLANALFQCYESNLRVKHCYALVDRGKEGVQELLKEVWHDSDTNAHSGAPGGGTCWPTYSYGFTMKELGIEDEHPSSETAA